jgi:phage protein D
MTNLTSLTSSQLKAIINIKERIEELQGQIDSIVAEGHDFPGPFAESPAPAKRKYKMTAAHKRKLIKALKRARKIRWAKAKSKPAKGKDRRSSPAVRAKLAAAAKARWARVRAEGKTRL